MPVVNLVVIAGNLTRDPELKYLQNGTAVCDLSLALSRKYRDAQGEVKEEVSFIDVTAFGKTAELASQYLAKGRPVLFEGSLKQERWDDKETGQKRSKLKVVAQRMQFLGGPKDQDGEQKQPPANTNRGAAPQGAAPQNRGQGAPPRGRPSSPPPQGGTRPAPSRPVAPPSQDEDMGPPPDDDIPF
ncbi:MAG: single-stranded DNA-binding protein [Planctomycetes bacterium]|nr:single-stranded DNA-binding protein [Planctomycetota bacterium]